MTYLSKPFRVMILDDEPQITSLFRDIFIRLYGQDDFSIVVENDPVKALEMIDQEHFHILITDIYMPQVTGDEVVRQALAKQKGTQVIVITGDASYSNVINSFLDGATSFVAKPVERQRFKKAIDLCLDRIKFWQESVQESVEGKK